MVPMLSVLRGAGLSDVLAVTVRWFGGVKLGKGGLARAYAAAVRAALERLPTAIRVPRVELTVAVPIARAGAVKRLVHPPEVRIESETYGDLAGAHLVLSVEEERRAGLEEALAALQVTIEKVAEPIH